ncbi:hypothetical protein ACOMHN_052890 [Nucella lapillus]
MSKCLVFVFAAYMEYAVVTVLSRWHRKKLAGRRVRSTFKVVADRTRSPSRGSLGNLMDAYVTESEAPSGTPPASPHKKALPSFEKKGMDTGRMVNQLSRAIFPLAFAIFNVVYWVYFEVSE